MQPRGKVRVSVYPSTMMLTKRIIITAISALWVAGCSALPASGPTTSEVLFSSGSSENKSYVIVDVNHDVVRGLAAVRPIGLSQRFRKARFKAPKAKIGAGDVLSVSILEAGEGGLFSNTQSKRVTFAAIAVDKDGNITIPYAGVIPVKGRTPLEVQARIVKRLADRAIQPQALVNIVKNENNTIILSGDVTRPGRYPLTLKGDRLMDVVASAGGAKFPARETYVTFIRGKTTGMQMLKTIFEDSRENVYVRAGDRIFLTHDPRKYTVLGAVHKPGVYAFDSSRVNLLEAIAASGGLLDQRADATGLFVFRYENQSVLKGIKPDYDGSFGNVVPVVYRINMRDPSAYFYAQAFMLTNKDALYVSNAESIQAMKLLEIIRLGTGAIRGVEDVVN